MGVWSTWFEDRTMGVSGIHTLSVGVLFGWHPFVLFLYADFASFVCLLVMDGQILTLCLGEFSYLGCTLAYETHASMF